jgi:hypothetical protein
MPVIGHRRKRGLFCLSSDWQYVLHNDWRFESLHGEPDYKNLLAMMEKDMEKQREEAYELMGLKQ